MPLETTRVNNRTGTRSAGVPGDTVETVTQLQKEAKLWHRERTVSVGSRQLCLHLLTSQDRPEMQTRMWNFPIKMLAQTFWKHYMGQIKHVCGWDSASGLPVWALGKTTENERSKTFPGLSNAACGRPSWAGSRENEARVEARLSLSETTFPPRFFQWP